MTKPVIADTDHPGFESRRALMIIKKADRVKHQNSQKCTAFEYPLKDKDINVAFIEIKGRYPDNGFVTNEKVKELIFVVEGKGRININNDDYDLGKEDAALILPNEKYYFEGNLKLIVSCAPAWYPEQHKIIIGQIK